MNKDLLNKLKEKNEKDYKEIVEETINLKPTKIINKAYELAHYNEVCDFLDNVAYTELDDGWYSMDEENIQTIVDYKGNFIKKVYNVWLNYNHPERFNFFTYEDLIDIIKETLYYIRGKEN